MNTVLNFLTTLKPSTRVALVTHQRPDGDALGSCIGLASALNALGHQVSVVNASPVPKRLGFLQSDMLKHYATPDWYGEYDCVGVLDCGEVGRLDEVNQPATSHLPVFTIDHHVSSQGIGEAVWIEPEASSTGEMVVRLCRHAGWTLTRAAGTALWTAIVTDTGRFSYENTTPSCLEAATDCLVAGANPADISCAIYQSVSVAERELQAKVLGRMELHDQGKLAISWLRRDDFVAAGIGTDGAQDLINLVRDTEGVEVAFFLYEVPGDGPQAHSVKVSIRTAAPHNALAIAAKYNGGGHKRAAGCSIAATLDDAKGQILVAAHHAFFAE